MKIKEMMWVSDTLDTTFTSIIFVFYVKHWMLIDAYQEQKITLQQLKNDFSYDATVW